MRNRFRAKWHRLCLLSIAPVLFFPFQTYAQFSDTNTGATAGLVLALGNRFDRIGVQVNAYYVYRFVQINPALRFYYNFKSPGPKKRYGEYVASIGLCLGYGKTDSTYRPFREVISNQTRYINSFAYAYNCYFNKIGTTQQTGIICFQFSHFSFISENDIYARPMLDRFRTGALMLRYQDSSLQIALSTALWTGQMGKRRMDNPDFPAGYIDTSGAVYGNCSHGLLSLQVNYWLPYFQNMQVNMGVDAEQVRHAIQNRLIHDFFFIPRRWYSPVNAHIPMLDERDQQFLKKEGQKVRPAKLYYNAFLNPATFY